jgi:hypothetical protein
VRIGTFSMALPLRLRLSECRLEGHFKNKEEV